MLGVALLTTLLAAGCAGAGRRDGGVPAEVAAVGLPRAEQRYLLDPTASYPLLLDGPRQRRIEAAFLALVEGGDPEAAAAVAAELLAADPGLHPAAVLAAQAAFARGRTAEAADLLRPVVAELPAYPAAQLLLGRTAEVLGRLTEAYAAYLAAGGVSVAAAERAAAIRLRVLEIVANRVDDALARGRLDEARQHLANLREWAAEEDLTLEAVRRVAAAAGDPAAELAAVTALSAREPERRDLAERRADLELEVGDVREGLEIYRRLAAAHPGEPALEEKLEIAQYRYRLELLPEEARSLIAEPQLTRAQFAVLLYWLVPEVRRSRPAGARIAVDILDHPRREEIARVANLGLMEVDATLHRFSPDKPLDRLSALRSSLALLAASGRPPACLGAAGVPAAAEEACQAAARCGLIPEPAACLPRAPVSGREAVEILRNTLTHG